MDVQNLKRDARLELDIQSLALGGSGVGRVDQLVVFVPGAYPGERVRARVVKRRSHWIEAALEAVERPSPDRVSAPCRHFVSAECGGCRAQDYAYPAQVAAKTRQVEETLARVGGLAGVPVADTVPSPDTLRYRNKMEFSFHPGPDGAALLGLHRRDRFDEVFDLAECWIASELTNRIVATTRAFARAAGWPAYHARRHTGIARFLVVRHLPTTNQAGVHLVAARDGLAGVERWAAEVAALDPAVKSIVLSTNDGRANVAFGTGERVLFGARTIEERLLGLTFEAGPNAFLQTNSRQAEALYTAAIEEAGLTGTETVLDLYCGAGTISLALARHAAQVVGVETIEAAIADARANAQKNGVTNARFACGDARAVLRVWAKTRAGKTTGPDAERVKDAKAPRDPAAYEPVAPDVVVVDPPRAGLHERVIERVCELAPARVVYVSCNPGTLARDLALFAKGGYATTRVRPFDMFPHTPHVECVARLDRAAV
jgi:23S rRNA (uracil1939-C5)-methyltransferase